MKIRYIFKRFNRSSRVMIEDANSIIRAYQQDGYDLTLRQLYYQFVSRNLLANSNKNYKRLGSVVNDARLAGLIDWNSLVDRTRNLRSSPHWLDPAEIIESAAQSYAIDMWANQDFRPEVWIEKDALLGVIEKVCVKNDVPFFSCRGYTSQSEMWGASQRMRMHRKEDQTPVIIHLGDHDPSGMDMSRDILNRIQNVFRVNNLIFERIALNMDQVEQYNPPPNPTKLSDSRAENYIAEFGPDSWELDALEPRVMNDLIQEHIDKLRDRKKWDEDLAIQEKDRKNLSNVSGRWYDVVEQFGY